MLAVFGERDLQVPPSQSADEMRAALEAARTDDFTVRVFPGLNHLFQHAATGGPGEYGQIEETFAPEVLDAISDWIVGRR